MDDRYSALRSPGPAAPPRSAAARLGPGVTLLQLCGALLQGALAALAFPLLKRRLRLQGFQLAAAQALLAVAAACRLGLGALVGRLPLPRGWRSRRPPLVYAGWLLVLLLAVLLARLHASLDEATEAASSQSQRVRAETAQAGAWTVLLLVGVVLGSALAESGCEAVMVDIEHANSPSDVAAGASGWSAHKKIYAMRFAAEAIGAVMVGVSLNDATFGGNFSFAASVASIFEVVALVALIAIAGTMWGVSEAAGCNESSKTSITSRLAIPSQKAAVASVAPSSPPSVVIELEGLRSVLQNSSVWQLALYSFLQKLFLDLQSSPRLTIHALWLHTDPMLMSFAVVVTSGVYALASVLAHRVLLTDISHWRGIVTRAVMAGGAISLIIEVFTALDIVRDKYFVLMSEQLVIFTSAIAVMVRMTAMIEIAEAGKESGTYAVITAFTSLAEPISAALSNYLSAAFSLFDESIESDSAHVRRQVIALSATLVCLRLAGNIVILPLLPRDRGSANLMKAECRIEEGDSDIGAAKNRWIATAVVVIVITVSIAALSANVMAVLVPTACLPLAGGPGC